MARQLRFSIEPSTSLAVALCAAHFAAAGAVWLVPAPAWGKAMLIITIAWSLIFYLARCAALHAPDAIVALEIKEQGGISFQMRRGEWLDCELHGSSFISPHLMIVNLRPRGRRLARYVILVPDNVDAEDFRRLRMWLRWSAQPDARLVGSRE